MEPEWVVNPEWAVDPRWAVDPEWAVEPEWAKQCLLRKPSFRRRTHAHPNPLQRTPTYLMCHSVPGLPRANPHRLPDVCVSPLGEFVVPVRQADKQPIMIVGSSDK